MLPFRNYHLASPLPLDVGLFYHRLYTRHRPCRCFRTMTQLLPDLIDPLYTIFSFIFHVDNVYLRPFSSFSTL